MNGYGVAMDQRLRDDLWEHFVLQIAPEAQSRPEHFRALVAQYEKFESALQLALTQFGDDDVMVRDDNEANMVFGMFAICLVERFMREPTIPEETRKIFQEFILRRCALRAPQGQSEGVE